MIQVRNKATGERAEEYFSTRNRTVLFFSLLIVVSASYGRLIEKHYALDTYLVEAFGNISEQHAALGRHVSAAILQLCSLLGVNTAVYQSFFTLVAIVILSFALFLLVELFRTLSVIRTGKEQTFFIALALTTTVCNLFVLHWFLFPEVILPMALGFLAAVIALLLLAKDSFSCRVWSVAALLFALCCYQAVGAFFLAYALLYMVCSKGEASPLSALRIFVSPCLISLLAGTGNILLMKWFGGADERTRFHETDIIGNIQAIFINIAEKLDTTNIGVTPVIIFSIVILLFFSAALYTGLRQRNREKLAGLLSLILLCFAVIGANLAPHSITSVVDVSPRSIAALMALPGVIAIFAFFILDISGNASARNFVTVLLLLFLCGSLAVGWRVQSSRFATNALDRAVAMEVIAQIKAYEQASGKTITHLALHHDINQQLCYPDQLCYGNFRAMGRDWAVAPLLSVVAGRRFLQVEMPADVYSRYFHGKEWQEFSGEQLLFKDNILYMVLY